MVINIYIHTFIILSILHVVKYNTKKQPPPTTGQGGRKVPSFPYILKYMLTSGSYISTTELLLWASLATFNSYDDTVYRIRSIHTVLLKLLLFLHKYLCWHFLPSNLLPLVRILRSTYKCESWMRPNLETIPLYCRWEKYAAPIDVGISHEVKCRNTLPTDARVCLSINSMSFFNFYLSRLIFFSSCSWTRRPSSSAFWFWEFIPLFLSPNGASYTDNLFLGKTCKHDSLNKTSI